MKEIINVIGLGYIGLPTALMLAETGENVRGTDLDEKKINMLRSGKLTFHEKGMSELFNNAISKGILFDTSYVEADIYIIAVPTPYNKGTRKVVVDYLISALEKVLIVSKEKSIIVIESTVSPGTIDKYIRPLVDEENRKNKKNISIVHAPERVIPGNMINELKNNNRIIGSDSISVGKKIKELYTKFCDGEIVLTDIRTAELAKVAENTFRDINIAYANELVKICREAKINVYELIKIANMHPRVNILNPGPGVGGHCISVDPWFLVGDYPEIANLILTARRVNDSMPEYVLTRIARIMNENNISSIEEVGLYGLTYKENVDDIRESPTLQLLSYMKTHASVGVRVYDPYITSNITKNQKHSLKEFLEGIKLVVIMVGHKEIIENQDMLHNYLVLDTRNVIDKDDKYSL